MTQDTVKKLPSTPLLQAIRTTAPHMKRLKELGIETVEDFLRYFPRRYTDQRDICPIREIPLNTAVTIRGEVHSIETLKSWKRRMAITTALIQDETGVIKVVWFNQPFIERQLQKGREVMISGKAKYDVKKETVAMTNPLVELIRPEQIHTARIVPIYHETELGKEQKRMKGKISSKWIREKLFPLLPYAELCPDFLPQDIKEEYRLMALPEAIREAHFPSSEEKLHAAKERLAFDELFTLQLAALWRRSRYRKIAHDDQKKMAPDWELMKKFSSSLPWPLTNAQKKAIYEIIEDMGKPFPMSRLLEGDTGSGKTVVAAAAIVNAVKAGLQTCFMAPTELLARQHAKTLAKVLQSFHIEPMLLVGSLKHHEKNVVLEKIATGKTSCVIGTHALIQERVRFSRLGLAVVDEQHRFGVRQREIIKSFGNPHILSLTATPIPRTLALVLYGDQDLSILDEMPPSRRKIITRIVPEEKRNDAYAWIRRKIEQGRQAFIIFPLIDESPVLQVKAATKEYEKLAQEIFPAARMGLLHGQMPAQEKEAVMENFSRGTIQILVSTAVVEVGVDVPNATIMMIEGAERFGLAQLHQFRGRVGRGTEQSYCLLFPTLQTSQILKRLYALVLHDSGFKLAEIDLQLRGPGEVYGTAQSGIPDLKMANLSDAGTIKKSREAVEKILDADPELITHKDLRRKIDEQENIAVDF